MIEVSVTTVRRGSTGGRVKKMQALINANFIGAQDQPLQVDGSFGAGTEERVRMIQSFFGATVDGVVGPKTWSILENIPA